MLTLEALLTVLVVAQGSTDRLAGPADHTPIPRRSPMGALLRSSVLPGWGQLYNDKYFKGVLLGTAELSLLTVLLMENSAAGRARDDYLESGLPADEARYELHRQRRLDFIWYTSAAWLYGMLDAYVDAHLFPFEIENERFDRDAGLAAGIVVRF